MKELKIYQIGLGSFGRHGFDKLVEISKEYDKITLAGVCDRDFERLDHAKQFAKVNGIEVETFQKIDEMYNDARRQNTEILVYDAGPTESHSKHIYRSMQNDFFHLAEKPPSMNRGEHIREKRMSEKGKAMWKADFIERESPVVKQTLEIIEEDSIDKIKVFRESSVGIEKALDPVSRLGVKGGDILDKMVHEVYVLDFIEESTDQFDLEFENAETRYFQPKEQDSEKLSTIYSSPTDKIQYDTATAMTHAKFNSENIDVELHSSWFGFSDETRFAAQRIEENTGHKVLERDYSEINDTAYVNEEARFFIIEGEKDLVGDMLQNKLYNLETGEEIELDNFIHDQLYRVLEKAVFNAQGRDVEIISDKEIDVFMNSIFDVKENISYEKDFFEEISKANQKIRKMVVEDRKVLETEVSETIAG